MATDRKPFLAEESKRFDATGHDSRCENRPGGEYHGRTVQFSNPPMPIPCHCSARADGRRLAQREIRRNGAR